MPKHRPRKKKTSVHSSTSPDAQRLNKILAAAGLGSRRKVEELIEQGRVEIDGDIVTDLSCKVEPKLVKIKVDGQLLKQSRPVYYALNKPPGVLSTNYDPSGRMRVIDLVPDRDRVFSVGRLDQSSEGLMLLTNDGELAQRLAHPKFRIQKSYFVVVSGQMTEDELTKLRKGVHLAEGFARIDGATIKRVRKGCTEIEIVLSEGKNREIRRILARAGHKVVLLRRIAIGPLRLGQMPVGASRMLTSSEVKALYLVSDPKKRPKQTPEKAPKSIAATGAKKAAAKIPDAKHLDDDDDDLLSQSLAGDGDDDFVGDFSGSGGVGSVISFDEDAAGPPLADERVRRRNSRTETSKPARGSTAGRASKSPRTPKSGKKTAYGNSRSSAGRTETGGKPLRKSSGKTARSSATGKSPGRGATSARTRKSVAKNRTKR